MDRGNVARGGIRHNPDGMRKRYSAEFEADVILELMWGETTLARNLQGVGFMRQ